MWQDDSKSVSCVLCRSLFSLLNRKHHCRVCGQVVCGSCCKLMARDAVQNVLTRPAGAWRALNIMRQANSIIVCDKCGNKEPTVQEKDWAAMLVPFLGKITQLVGEDLSMVCKGWFQVVRMHRDPLLDLKSKVDLKMEAMDRLLEAHRQVPILALQLLPDVLKEQVCNDMKLPHRRNPTLLQEFKRGVKPAVWKACMDLMKKPRRKKERRYTEPFGALSARESLDLPETPRTETCDILLTLLPNARATEWICARVTRRHAEAMVWAWLERLPADNGPIYVLLAHLVKKIPHKVYWWLQSLTIPADLREYIWEVLAPNGKQQFFLENSRRVLKCFDADYCMGADLEGLILPTCPDFPPRTCQEVRILSSVTKPMAVTWGNDMTCTTLFKREDMRKDAILTDIIPICNSFLDWKHQMVTYQVVPTGVNQGIAQFVPNAKTVWDVTSNQGGISAFLVRHNGDVRAGDVVEEMRASLAMYSVFVWVWGVSDRVNRNNIMLTGTGKVFHVDYSELLCEPCLQLDMDMLHFIRDRENTYRRFLDMCVHVFRRWRRKIRFFHHVMLFMGRQNLVDAKRVLPHLHKVFQPDMQEYEACAHFRGKVQSVCLQTSSSYHQLSDRCRHLTNSTAQFLRCMS